MEKVVYISKYAHQETKDYIKNKGYEIRYIEAKINTPIFHHQDLSMCKLGVLDDEYIFFGDVNLLKSSYPYDAIYNGASTGKYFIHNTKITNPTLLAEVKRRKISIINVKQGYCRCNILPIDENSFITSDAGIYKQCKFHNGLDVLLVDKESITLKGYKNGFLGGTAGRVGDEVVFNGNLESHPDLKKILKFIEEPNLKVTFFKGCDLEDIGSIISFTK